VDVPTGDEMVGTARASVAPSLAWLHRHDDGTPFSSDVAVDVESDR
jgi:hypothetical protein